MFFLKAPFLRSLHPTSLDGVLSSACMHSLPQRIVMIHLSSPLTMHA